MADYRTFSVKLDEFAERVRIVPSKIIKHIAFDLWGRIIQKTPVDTGRARGSWTIAVNQANRAVLPPVPPGTPPHTVVYPAPAVSSGYLDVKPGDSIVISNNLPYITALENGHSKQSAPHAMVGLSIEEVKLKMAAFIAAGKADVGLV